MTIRNSSLRTFREWRCICLVAVAAMTLPGCATLANLLNASGYAQMAESAVLQCVTQGQLDAALAAEDRTAAYDAALAAGADEEGAQAAAYVWEAISASESAERSNAAANAAVASYDEERAEYDERIEALAKLVSASAAAWRSAGDAGQAARAESEATLLRLGAPPVVAQAGARGAANIPEPIAAVAERARSAGANRVDAEQGARAALHEAIGAEDPDRLAETVAAIKTATELATEAALYGANTMNLPLSPALAIQLGRRAARLRAANHANPAAVINSMLLEAGVDTTRADSLAISIAARASVSVQQSGIDDAALDEYTGAVNRTARAMRITADPDSGLSGFDFNSDDTTRYVASAAALESALDTYQQTRAQASAAVSAVRVGEGDPSFRRDLDDPDSERPLVDDQAAFAYGSAAARVSLREYLDARDPEEAVLSEGLAHDTATSIAAAENAYRELYDDPDFEFKYATTETVEASESGRQYTQGHGFLDEARGREQALSDFGSTLISGISVATPGDRVDHERANRKLAYEIASNLAARVRREYDETARRVPRTSTHEATADRVARSQSNIDAAVSDAEDAYLEVATRCGPAPGAFEENWFDQQPGCNGQRTPGTGGGTSGGGGRCD